MKTFIICIQTLCGKITPVGFGSKEDRRFLERWREFTHATLLGAGSLRAGDPEFRDTSGRIPEKRIRAIITMSGRLPLEKNIFNRGPAPIVFCGQDVSDSLRRRLGGRAEVVAVRKREENELDLCQIREILGEKGVSRLLVEGGGRLNYFCLKQGIVDEMLVTVAPKLLTSNRETPLVDGESNLGAPFLDLELVSCKCHLRTGELFLRYKVLKGKNSG